jgi:protease-4
MNTPLRPASSSRLLNDFIASPVGMKPAHHLALIGDLHAGRLGPRASLTPGNQTVNEYFVEGAKGPWNAPLYTLNEQTGIGLLEITGPLIKGYDDFTAWWYECASIDRIDRALDALFTLQAAGRLRALVVVLNTPGGMSTGMPELAAKLAELANRILVVTHTSDTAASNGMRLAASGTLFLPTASAVVGCIGTYIALYNFTKQLEEIGIKLELYRAGKYKGWGLEGKDTTEEEAAFVQGEVERSNEIFRDFVRSRRPEAPLEAMEGQWFDGARAEDYGLADGTVTGLPEVLRKVADTLAAS